MNEQQLKSKTKKELISITWDICKGSDVSRLNRYQIIKFILIKINKLN